MVDPAHRRRRHRDSDYRDPPRSPVGIAAAGDAECVADVLDALNEKVTVHDEIRRTTAKLRDTLAPALLTGALLPHDTELPTSHNWP
jgi:hypothetical protein